MNRNKLIKTASIISIAGNAVLAVVKITAGVVSGSASVTGDGLDSLTDILISFITLAASIIIAAPPDEKHPYGHHRAETIATTLLAFIIFFIGGQLTLSMIRLIVSGAEFVQPEPLAVYVTIFSIAGKFLLARSQLTIGRKTSSAMLTANAKNMQNDIITSAGVLAGLAAAYFFGLPIIDKILAAIIGCWIMFSAFKIFMGTVTELMEGEHDRELYEKIFEIVRCTPGIHNPHRVRIKKIGAVYAVDMDVEVNPALRVIDAHESIVELEGKIKAAIPAVYDIVVHMEPLGNFEHDECFGLEDRDPSRRS